MPERDSDIINQKAKHIINQKNVRIAIVLQIFHALLLVVGVFFLGNFKSDASGRSFLHFGPSTKKVPINIFGLNIDTWTKWGFLIGFLVISEMINTFSVKIYNNWYKNIVSDPKSDDIRMKNHEAMVIINIWDITTWMSRTFKWMIMILTKQLQFMLPQFIAYLLVANQINSNYISSKNKFHLHKR